MGAALIGGGGGGGSNIQGIIDQVFPGGLPTAVETPEIEFDPDLFFQGIEFFREQLAQGLDFAGQQFAKAETFQQPFFNQARGFQALSEGVLGGQFDPRDPANAFTFDPSDPEFQFLQQRGVGAIDAAASARGLLGSGSRLKDLTQFGQGLASTFADQALNRRRLVAGDRLNALSGLAGFEQAAANNLSNISTGFGQLGFGGFTGLGSGALSALSNAAGAQNNIAIQNANNALTGQVANINALIGLIGQQQPRPDRIGQLIGAGASVLPFLV